MEMSDFILSLLVLPLFWSRNPLLFCDFYFLFEGGGGEERKKHLPCKSEVLCEREKPWFITSEEDTVCDS